MQLPPGVVSPFGLLMNEDHDIRVFIDQEIISQPRMSFHPNTNEKTIFLSTEDLLHFIESIGYESEVVTL
jgi:Ala-tRNA(Pro) deacylase